MGWLRGGQNHGEQSKDRHSHEEDNSADKCKKEMSV
jgi:hypothetical protein